MGTFQELILVKFLCPFYYVRFSLTDEGGEYDDDDGDEDYDYDEDEEEDDDDDEEDEEADEKLSKETAALAIKC